MIRVQCEASKVNSFCEKPPKALALHLFNIAVAIIIIKIFTFWVLSPTLSKILLTWRRWSMLACGLLVACSAITAASPWAAYTLVGSFCSKIFWNASLEILSSLFTFSGSSCKQVLKVQVQSWLNPISFLGLMILVYTNPVFEHLSFDLPRLTIGISVLNLTTQLDKLYPSLWVSYCPRSKGEFSQLFKTYNSV